MPPGILADNRPRQAAWGHDCNHNGHRQPQPQSTNLSRQTTLPRSGSIGRPLQNSSLDTATGPNRVGDTRLARTGLLVAGHKRGVEEFPDESDHAEDDDSGSDAESSGEAEESDTEEITRTSQPTITDKRLVRPGVNQPQTSPSALIRPAPTQSELFQPSNRTHLSTSPYGQLGSTTQQQRQLCASGRKSTTDVKVDNSQNVYNNQNHSTTDNRVTNHHHKTVVQNDGELHKQWAEQARSSLQMTTATLTGCQAEVKRLQRALAEKDDNYTTLWGKCQTLSTAHTKAETRAGTAEGQVKDLKAELNEARQKSVDQQRRIEWQQRALIAAQGGTLPFDKLERLIRIWWSLTEQV